MLAFAFQLNTYQSILVSDGRFSFAIFLYPRGGIQWTTGDASGGREGLGGRPAYVGFNSGDGTHYTQLPESGTSAIINLDKRSNVGHAGMYIFRIDGT